MAGRKKTQFTDEMNQLINDRVNEGRNLQEIVDELMNGGGLSGLDVRMGKYVLVVNVLIIKTI